MTAVAPDTAEVLATQLLEAADDSGEVIEGIIVDAGALLPFTAAARVARSPREASLVPVPEVDAETLRKLGVAAFHSLDLSRRSMAGNTVRNYESAWNSFVSFCEERDVCALPAHPVTVGTYLTLKGQAFQNGQQVCREAGAPKRGELRPQSAALHLTAINRYHVANTFPRPGDSTYVQNVLRGLKRTFGMHKDNRKSALLFEHLERMVGVVREIDADATRDRALAVLASRPEAGAGLLARLTADRIDLTRREAIVRLPSPTRSAAGERTLTFAATGDPATCPVEALNAQLRHVTGPGGLLRADMPLFPTTVKPEGETKAALRAAAKVNKDATGSTSLSPEPHRSAKVRPTTKQGLAKAIRRLATHLDRDDLAGITACELRTVLRAIASPTPAQVRDEALLTTGWITAMRRSSIEFANWGHVRLEEDRVVIDMQWSKTNQERSSEEDTDAVIPLINEAEGAFINPGRAFLTWRALVTTIVGGPPERVVPEWPIFVPIDRHGNLERTAAHAFRRLTDEAINELVQSYAERIGLERRRYGSHSLRIGLVTQMLRDGASVQDVQQITKHKSVDVLLGYYRAEERRKNDPARRLLSRRVAATGDPTA